MGIEGKSKVFGKGNVEFASTSGKKMTLTNVLHVLDMNRNLVSGVLLGKSGIKSIFESRKLILSHNDIFVGKDYSTSIKIYLLLMLWILLHWGI